MNIRGLPVSEEDRLLNIKERYQLRSMFDKYIQDTPNRANARRCARMLGPGPGEGMPLNDSLYSTSKQDWSTPQALFDKLDQEFHFDLDVCASAENAKCAAYFDKDKDGLSQEWKGACWCNPPYGRGIEKWVRKACECSDGPATCVCLLPVRSDTRWWHNFVMKAKEIRLLTRRLSFEGSSNKAPFPAAVVIFDGLWIEGMPVLRAMEI